ncbi:unnamed protein product [Polarella glacialis]|uniref:Uncharacterized protein n=1 Tax=Polarella glacialis TaxID=89957 RepID=A0A813GZV0_POLGL|nr:unnamed protein product [Polarella glacialis]
MEKRRLDAFQARCLRIFLGVKHSMISRISNADVLARAQCRFLSSVLLERQMLLMGDLASRPDSDILRRSVFSEGSMQLRGSNGPRGRGRPWATWAGEVFKHTVTAAGNFDSLSRLWLGMPAAKSAWQALVRQYCTS